MANKPHMEKWHARLIKTPFLANFPIGAQEWATVWIDYLHIPFKSANMCNTSRLISLAWVPEAVASGRKLARQMEGSDRG